MTYFLIYFWVTPKCYSILNYNLASVFDPNIEPTVVLDEGFGVRSCSIQMGPYISASWIPCGKGGKMGLPPAAPDFLGFDWCQDLTIVIESGISISL